MDWIDLAQEREYWIVYSTGINNSKEFTLDCILSHLDLFHVLTDYSVILILPFYLRLGLRSGTNFSVFQMYLILLILDAIHMGSRANLK
jgi:hypothetical protein